MELTAAAREARKSPSVLRLKLSNIRTKDPDIWVFVFEGVDDVGVYESWIKRAAPDLEYEPLPSSGKEQVLGFREQMKNDRTGLRSRVKYFVDRDFDDLRGAAPGDDLFCTARYSVENYLVSEIVLDSFLKDELRCAADKPERVRIRAVFADVLQQFLTSIKAANLRIFVARRRGVNLRGIDDSIGKYVAIEVDRVTAVANDDELKRLIEYALGEVEPSAGEVSEFNALHPRSAYRGKFLYSFFRRWLEVLCEDRRAMVPVAFSARAAVPGLSPGALSLRALAARSEIPEGLRQFLEPCRGKDASTKPKRFAVLTRALDWLKNLGLRRVLWRR